MSSLPFHLPFAMRLSDGKEVSPEEVDRGKACNCVCRACQSEVIAKKGTEREWHFAHGKGAKCAEGYEVSIHEMAKQLLRQRNELLLPALVAKVSAINAYGVTLQEVETVFQSNIIPLDDCKTGVQLDGVNIDAVGLYKEQEILVEITVFHRLMPDKLQRIVETKKRSMQINLDQFTTMQVTKESLEYALFEDKSIRHWLHHPKLERSLKNIQAKLDGRLAESKIKFDNAKALLEKQQRENLERIRTQPVKSSWSPVVSAAFTETTVQQKSLMFSASFPSAKELLLPAKRLAEKTGLSEELILNTASSYPNRGQISGYTVERFATECSESLNLPVKETEDFLVDAGYLLRR